MAEPLKRLLRSLNAAGVEYIVIGGHAVGFHGYPRATKDLDLLYLQTEDNARRIADCVSERVDGVTYEDFMGPPAEFAVLRFKGERVDLLPEIDGVSTREALERAVPGVLFGVPTRFISKADLLANKRSAARPQDAVDADAIEDE